MSCASLAHKQLATRTCIVACYFALVCQHKDDFIIWDIYEMLLYGNISILLQYYSDFSIYYNEYTTKQNSSLSFYFGHFNEGRSCFILLLKTAIVRLTRGAHALNKIPPSWSSFARHLTTIHVKAPQLLCIPYDEVVSISRSFDIVPGHVPLMLRSVD